MLPPYYLEVIMTGLYGYCVDEWVRGPSGALYIFFTKGPGGFPYVFIITREVTTLEPINGPNFLTIGSLSLGRLVSF